MIRGGADGKIIEIKCTVKVMRLNHPETFPPPTHIPVHGKIVFHDPVPDARKVVDRCCQAPLVCMTPHHLQSPLLGFATGWHGAQWYRGYDRMQNFSYLPMAGHADEVKPGDWISTPHSFPLHPMMGLGPHNGFTWSLVDRAAPGV